jgi:hypothetical protein
MVIKKLETNMSLEDYIALVKQYQEDGELNLSECNDIIKNAIDTAGNEKKEILLNRYHSDAIQDLTDVEIDKIIETMQTATNLKVGGFSIRVRNHTGKTVDLILYEDKLMGSKFSATKKSPIKLNILKDVRFEDCEWLKYFKNGTQIGAKIPVETAIEIIRWCQAVTKIGAFA